MTRFIGSRGWEDSVLVAGLWVPTGRLRLRSKRGKVRRKASLVWGWF